MDLKNSKRHADAMKLIAEHAELARYLELAIPFLKKVGGLSGVYEDGQALLKKVQGK